MRRRLILLSIAALTTVVVAIAFAEGIVQVSLPRDHAVTGTNEQVCGAEVIDDWVDNGRFDRRHEVSCYRAALARLPEDLRAYTSANDDIEHALRGARANDLRIKLTLVGRGFGALTHVVGPPDDPSRLVVVQQDGLVPLLEEGVRRARPFIDLRSDVVAEGEKGLLSIAFAPDYATSGRVYAYYNNRDGNIRVVEYLRSAADPDTVDPSSRRVLLAIANPAPDHNGGMMQFGPDGNLYIAVGDGGADPPTIPVGATGQTLDDLLGSILRVDPSHGTPYAIPPGNPFETGSGARPEIVAYGLRNPWRFWIDPEQATMFIGDVGEGAREEIDLLPLDMLGLNFGWPCEEGTTTPRLSNKPESCKTAVTTPPVWQYRHSTSRCSITGGVVARDPQLPQLEGLFLWTDLCDSQVYGLDPAADEPAEIPLGIGAAQPTSLGTDALGRIYLATYRGALYRIDPRYQAR